MKIERLEVVKPFGQAIRDLDFSGNASLHVIWGPNEAGKSTLRRLLIDLFFGGPVTPWWAHFAESGAPPIQAWLSPDLHLRRKKVRNRLALDVEGLDEETWLAQYFGGLNRERYLILFGLDHQGLREGGDHLLKSEGHAGISLFEAGGGLHDWQTLLQTLREESSGLLDPKFRRNGTAALSRAMRQYRDAKNHMREWHLRPQEWRSLKKELDQLARELKASVDESRALSVERSRIQRVMRVRGPLDKWRALTADREELNVSQLMSAADREQLFHAIDEDKRVSSLIRQWQETWQHLEDRRRELHLDPLVIEYEDRINDLIERLAQYKEAHSRLPAVEEAVRELKGAVLQQLKRIDPSLSWNDIEGLRLPLVAVRRVQKLTQTWREALAQYRDAQERVNRARQEYQTIDEKCQQLGEVRDVEALQALLKEIGHSQAVDDLVAETESQIAVLQADIHQRLAGQRYWGGTYQELLSIPWPNEVVISRYEEELRHTEEAVRDLKTALLLIEKEYDEAVEQLAAIEGDHRVPTEYDITKAREVRDGSWRVLRTHYVNGPYDVGRSKELADQFEWHLGEADVLVDAARREAKKVAEANARQAKVARSREALANMRRRYQEAQEGLLKLTEQWRSEWLAMGIEPGPPQEMKEFMQTVYDRLVRDEQTLRAQQAKLDARLKQRQQYHEALLAIGTKMGYGWDGQSYYLLKSQAESALKGELDKAREIDMMLNKRQDSLSRVNDEALRLATLTDQIHACEVKWGDLVGQYPLLPKSWTDAPDYLEAVELLFAHYADYGRRQAELDSLMSLMEAFQRDSYLLAELLDEEAKDLDSPMGMVSRIKNRLSQALEQDQLERQLRASQKEAKAHLAEALSEQQQICEVMDGLHQRYGVMETPDLIKLANLSVENERLSREIDDLAEHLRSAGDGLSVDALWQECQQAEAAGMGPEQLMARADELEKLVAEEQERWARLTRDAAEKDVAFSQWDGSDIRVVQAAQEAEAALWDVDQLWNQYLRVELSIRILERSIERFREANQSPVLMAVAEIFSRLTKGAYRDVRVDYDEQTPYLVAVHESGMSRRVGELSQGTRDQLYLSLRLAFVSRSEPGAPSLPLLLDDILVDFDDDRSQAALSVLRDLSHDTQILYFTHHHAIVEAAQSLSGDEVKVHYLSD